MKCSFQVPTSSFTFLIPRPNKSQYNYFPSHCSFAGKPLGKSGPVICHFSNRFQKMKVEKI